MIFHSMLLNTARKCIITLCVVLSAIHGLAVGRQSKAYDESEIIQSRPHGEATMLHLTRGADPSKVNLYAEEDAVVSELARFSLEAQDYARLDVWISSRTKPLTCLFLVERPSFNIREFLVYPYAVEESEQEGRLYRSHLHAFTRRIGGRDEILNRIAPLNVRVVLRSKLEEDSPLRDPEFPAMSVRTLDAVEIVDRQGVAYVTGVLNEAWSFDIELSIDEKVQRVTPGHVSLRNLERDTPHPE